MIQAQFVPIILIYILIGLSWADFMHSVISKSGKNTEWSNSKKRLVMILWPLSFLVVSISIISQIIKTINNQS